MSQAVKCLLAIQETWVRSLDREDPLEKEIATHSSTLAWKIICMEEPGRLQTMGHKELDTTGRLHFLSFFLSFFLSPPRPHSCPLSLTQSQYTCPRTDSTKAPSRTPETGEKPFFFSTDCKYAAYLLAGHSLGFQGFLPHTKLEG